MRANITKNFHFGGMENKDLVRGSGMFVPESGIVTNHHFNPLHTDTLFRVYQGKYKLELVAKLIRKNLLISL